MVTERFAGFFCRSGLSISTLIVSRLSPVRSSYKSSQRVPRSILLNRRTLDTGTTEAGCCKESGCTAGFPSGLATKTGPFPDGWLYKMMLSFTTCDRRRAKASLRRVNPASSFACLPSLRTFSSSFRLKSTSRQPSSFKSRNNNPSSAVVSFMVKEKAADEPGNPTITSPTIFRKGASIR